ncbi:unnamed protein product [Arctia plantaginis]|uniref:PiggyBac transposable element-derived protein domain-containing protein n=1 Tax=Arctia plantaginis TaxID=874455 RepID=A0A8S1B7N4_ARCPL|nr:unnamed protein product [Arctia plantaginis]
MAPRAIMNAQLHSAGVHHARGCRSRYPSPLSPLPVLANTDLFTPVAVLWRVNVIIIMLLQTEKYCFIVKMDAFFDFEFTQEQLLVIDNLERSNCSEISEGDEVLNIPRARKRRIVLSDDEEDERGSSPGLSGHTPTTEWYQPRGKQPRLIPFTEIPGLKPYSLRNQLANGTPADFYSLLVTDHLFEDIAHQTNIFAQQNIDKGVTKDKSRLRLWTPTDKEEIKRFLGVHWGRAGHIILFNTQRFQSAA